MKVVLFVQVPLLENTLWVNNIYSRSIGNQRASVRTANSVRSAKWLLLSLIASLRKLAGSSNRQLLNKKPR